MLAVQVTSRINNRETNHSWQKLCKWSEILFHLMHLPKVMHLYRSGRDTWHVYIQENFSFCMMIFDEIQQNAIWAKTLGQNNVCCLNCFAPELLNVTKEKQEYSRYHQAKKFATLVAQKQSSHRSFLWQLSGIPLSFSLDAMIHRLLQCANKVTIWLNDFGHD